MKKYYSLCFAICCWLLIGTSAMARQTKQLSSEQVDNLLVSMIKPLSDISPHPPSLKIPRRKYDSPLFCNELIPWKNGFIINSLSLAPGRTTDISYRFFYLDMATKKLFKLKCEQIDSIESLITWKNALYLSGRKNGQCRLIRIENGVVQLLTRQVDKAGHIGDSSWVKLGVYGNKLLALQKDGAFLLGTTWEPLAIFSLDSFYLKKGYRRSRAVIPTENIRVHNNNIYFVQEVTQQRDADLMTLTTGPEPRLTEFWESNHMVDNTKKELMSYLPVHDGIWVAQYRLMTNSILMKHEPKGTSLLVLNNYAYTPNQRKVTVMASCLGLEGKDSILLIGTSGIYRIEQNNLKTLVYFENVEQEIKMKGGDYQYTFVPRSCARLGEDVFLVGGLWGGIYLFNIAKKSVQCYDDLKNSPPVIDIMTIAD